MEFLSRGYRKSTYEKWKELPLIKAVSDGFIFSERTPKGALREIFVEEIYNVKGFTPQKNQTVIDVGANYGDSAIWWSKKFGAKVIAFEPLDDVFKILEENITLNKADVKAYNMALGNGSDISGNSEGTMLIKGGNVKFRTEYCTVIHVESCHSVSASWIFWFLIYTHYSVIIKYRYSKPLRVWNLF